MCHFVDRRPEERVSRTFIHVNPVYITLLGAGNSFKSVFYAGYRWILGFDIFS